MHLGVTSSIIAVAALAGLFLHIRQKILHGLSKRAGTRVHLLHGQQSILPPALPLSGAADVPWIAWDKQCQC